jgi:hypothetical protein
MSENNRKHPVATELFQRRQEFFNGHAAFYS